MSLFLCFSVMAQEQEDAPQTRFTGSSGMMSAKPKPKSEEKKRQPNVDMWLPPEFQSSEEKWPLIVFSHGFGGCGNQSKFLTSYLADHGYIVIAPDHEDADCSKSGAGMRTGLQDMHAGKSGRPERPFRNPDYWTEETERDRREDVLFAVSSMLDDRMYKNYIDVDRIGLIGYSLGGYTALGMAGGWKGWKDDRFKAVLALSPYIAPYVETHGLGRISVPVMYQGGTKDVGVVSSIKGKKGGGYIYTNAPKYYVELNGADHFSWTQNDTDYHDIIQKTALQFFDKHIKGEDVVIEYAPNKGQIKTFWKEDAKNGK